MKEHQINQIRRILDTRLQPEYISLVASAIVIFSVLLAVVMLVSSHHGRTVFGIPLGADFAGFYVAAQILNRGEPQQLYDRALHHRLYHELLPDEEKQVAIPYVHPPFVAGILRPLARLPYATAVAIWLVISAGLYISAMLVLIKALPWPVPKQNRLIVLLACSFEPFAFECWLGGQLSAIGFFSCALCLLAMRRSLPFRAGLALGICFYKPTLLLLILPMLLIGRRWQMLLGMTCTGIALVILSVLLVGWDVNVGYLNELLSFNKSTSGGDLEIRTWKYVDLNNCLRPWLQAGSSMKLPLLAMLGMLPFALLARAWYFWDRADDQFRRLIWATTLTWTPVLNLYFGIYDSILVVQSAYVTANIVGSDSNRATPLTSSGFAYLLLLIYCVPWFSQNLAAMTGVPVYTLLLMCLGAYQLGLLRQMPVQQFPTMSARA